MLIRCIDKKKYSNLTLNKEYEMLWEDANVVKIMDDTGNTTFYDKALFKPALIKEEKVHHPDHYNKGIEVIKYINSWEMDFLEGNIIKYVTRYKNKNGVEDLKKAKQYLDWLIEREEKENDK